MAWVDEHVVRQLEQPAHRVEQLSGEQLRPTLGVQVRPTHVTDKQRVTGKNEPGLVCAAPGVAALILERLAPIEWPDPSPA